MDHGDAGWEPASGARPDRGEDGPLADDSGSPEPLSLTGSRDLTRETHSRTGDCLRDGQRAPGGDRSVGSTI